MGHRGPMKEYAGILVQGHIEFYRNGQDTETRFM